jgi:hypothetical protein
MQAPAPTGRCELTEKQMRRAVPAAVLAAVIFAGAPRPGAAPLDYGLLTCTSLLASGQENMTYILWWLRGYHAGRRGVPMFDPQDAYAARLIYYCRHHPRANLVSESERILSELDRGR